ncbi:MAG: protein kinase [Deltaproteobacteria bacterium]|nr:protein kinase [Deltaproteobacteria bacterium]
MAGAPSSKAIVGRRFRIEGVLGSGSYGEVFSAVDTERGTEVALKRLHRADARGLYRFKREFRSLARLSHPNLVALYELFVEDGSWYLAMELVEGTPITDHLRPSGPLPTLRPGASLMQTMMVDEILPTDQRLAEHSISSESDATHFDPRPTPLDATEEDKALAQTLGELELEGPPEPNPVDLDWTNIARVFGDVADALATLHGAGMLHRDLKPHNVLVSSAGRPVVLDFGLVTELDPRGAGERTGMVIGTPNYMAPEQATGREVGPPSDLYALGVILYEVLTGRLPYEHPNLMTLLWRKVRGGAPKVRDLNPRVPERLAELCDALLEVQPKQRPDAAHVARGLGGRAPRMKTPKHQAFSVVGRDEELQALHQAFDETTRHAEPRLVLLEGESGMGKSALVETFLDAVAGQRDALLLPGRCYEQDFVPYKAMDALVDELSDHLGRIAGPQLRALLPPHAAELARLFPVFAAVLQSAEVSSAELLGDPVAARRRGFRALRELLFRLGRDRPIVAFVDDVQWGDPQSAEILLDQLRGAAAPPVLWLLAMRSEERSSPFPRALLERIESDPSLPVSRIALTPLRADASADLAGRILATNNPTIAKRIAKEAAGHPLFVEELARHARNSGTWDLDGDRSGETPDSDDRRFLLSQVLADRLRKLPPGSQRLLEVVAVAGVPITVTAAHRAASETPADRTTVHRLVAARLLRTQQSGDVERVAPYHSRIRSTLLEGLSAPARRELHRAIGHSLAEEGAPSRALLPHFVEAGEAALAALHAQRAGDDAARALAFEEAVQLYERALEWTDKMATPPQMSERRVLRRKLGEALVRAGRCREGARLHESLAREFADPLERSKLELSAAQAYYTSGATREGDGLLEPLGRQLGLPPASSRLRMNLQTAARLIRLVARDQELHERPQESIPTEEALRIRACFTLAPSLTLSDLVRALHYYIQGYELALRAGDTHSVAVGTAVLGSFFTNFGWKRAEILLARATELAKRVDTPEALGTAAYARGLQAFMEDDWLRALEELEAAHQQLVRVKDTVGVRHAALMQIPTQLRYLDRFRELDERTKRIVADAREVGNPYTEAAAMVDGAYASLALGHPAVARRSTASAREKVPGLAMYVRFASLTIDTLTELYLGRSERAHERIEDAWPGLRKAGLFMVRVGREFYGALRIGALLAVSEGARGLRGRRMRGRAKRMLRRWLGGAQTDYALGRRATLEAAIVLQDGDHEGAIDRLALSSRHFERAALPVRAATSRRRAAEILGDTDKVREIDELLVALDVADPARWTRAMAPGLSLRNVQAR